MSTDKTVETEVLAAAGHLVERFGAFDTDGYFACFAEDATFVFYPEPARLSSASEYRRLWDSWVADGWRVQACRSSDQLVQVLGDGGSVFSHAVETDIATADGRETLRERETIVFARRDGAWVAVHEHLSPRPELA